MSWTLNYQRGPNRQWRILGKSGGWGESEKIGKRLRWGDSGKLAIGKRWLREICSQLQVGCMLPLSYCSLHLWWFDLSWSLLHSTTCTLLERRNVTMDIRDTIWNSSCCHKFSVRLNRVKHWNRVIRHESVSSTYPCHPSAWVLISYLGHWNLFRQGCLSE